MKFDFFKTALPKDCFQGACDVHCHLLPGVDDGFPTTEKTLEALTWLGAHGIRKMKLTPHFMKEYPENTRTAIEERFSKLQEEWNATCAEQQAASRVASPKPVELSLAGEYMLDACFMDRCEEGFLTLDKEEVLVLCETSYLMMEAQSKERLYEIMLKGYQPVIAHPERYRYADQALYERWKQRDYLFQLNLLSLAGAYGNTAKAKARELLSKGMYDFVGSDLHRLSNLEQMVASIRLTKKEVEALMRLIENNKTL